MPNYLVQYFVQVRAPCRIVFLKLRVEEIKDGVGVWESTSADVEKP